MLKNTYYLMLLLTLIASTGCCTIKDTVTGAATGMQQDVQNLANPAANGWDSLEKVDAWMRENMW